MSKYATKKDVNNLKNALKDSYNEVFNACSEGDLSAKERRVYTKYLIENATTIYKNGGFRNLNEQEQIIYLNAKKKLEGDRLNNDNSRAALDVLRQAYNIHYSHTVPKWYQFTKRYQYWKESKAIKEYEDMLEKKGILPQAMETVKYREKNPNAEAENVLDFENVEKHITFIDELEEAEERNMDFVSVLDDSEELVNVA